MKYFIILSFVLSFLVSSCNKPNSKQSVSNIDKTDEKTDHSIKSQKILINGVWAKHENEPALFLILSDTLYYHERLDNPIPISIIGDTLMIFGKPPVKCVVLKLTKDSLWFKTGRQKDTTKLYNRE